MTPSWKVHDLDLTNEILPCSSAHFVSGFTTSSRVTDPWNAEKTVFKGLENSVFKILVFLHSATPTPQNSKFLPKLIKTLLDFYSKTSPRYFSSLVIFQFLDFVLDYLKPRVGVYFSVGLGKLTFLQKFSILLIGLSPILFVDDCVGPMRHFEHVFKAYFSYFHALFFI